MKAPKLNAGPNRLKFTSHYDPLSLVLAGLGLLSILASLLKGTKAKQLWDAQSFFVVMVGTFAVLVIQYDLKNLLYAFKSFALSLTQSAESPFKALVKSLDQAIIQGRGLYELRDGQRLTGDLVNDIVFMHKQGLKISEIELFVNSRIDEEEAQRLRAVALMARGATAAPALGLFGTVMGLMGVLRSLQNPQELGPSMSLALMTTAYGAVLGTLIFSPIQGRLETQAQIYRDVQNQILAKIEILLVREEKNLGRETLREDAPG